MKYINVKGIAIIAAILVVFQLAFGLVLSPILGKVVVDLINRSSDAKITIGSVNVWPLTLSFSMKELKVYDPDDPRKIMIEVKKASARMSSLALLSKRIVIMGVNLSGVDIDLVSEQDGSFNVAKIAQPKEEAGAPAQKASIFDRFKGKKDMFSKVFEMVKNRSSKEAVEGARQDRKQARHVKTEVVELPKGRRVLFKTSRDEYLMEVRKLSISDAHIRVESGGESIDVDRAGISMTGIAVDPQKGAAFDSIKVSGSLSKGGDPAGTFNLSYVSRLVREGVRTDVDVSAKRIDMPALSFIYQDSLPVEVNKGMLDLSSETTIVNDSLDSKNRLTLTGHDLEPASGGAQTVGIIPMPALCQALNQVDPLKLNVNITGTVDDPKFSGLEKTLQDIAKPYLENVVQKQAEGVLKGLIKKDTGASGGESASGETAAKDALKSIKSLFGEKK
jgi:hypothetical protein